MNTFSHLCVRVLWLPALLAILICSPDQASAQSGLSKDDQKCVNEVNKGFEKVGKAQGGDISKCTKDAGKGKLTVAYSECITSDPKGKVAKATGKLSGKVGDKCLGDPAFPPMDTSDTDSMNELAKAKELLLITALMGTDLDAAIVDCDDDKDGCKCQAGVVKQMYKCQSAKLKSFNACKKDQLKGKSGPAVTSAQELQDACMGTGTGDIDDAKGKIAKDCGAKLTSTIGKCTDPDHFPGCGSVDATGLAACVDRIVECEVCRALDVLDGLTRDCDVFDDNLANFTCPPASEPMGPHLSVLDPAAFCEGGANDGNACGDPLTSTDCTGGTCVAAASHSGILNTDGVDLKFLLDGTTTIDCGPIDPNTGISVCQCNIVGIIGQDISPIGAICFEALPDFCPPGIIDCDGGTPLDQQLIANHDVGDIVVALDPNQFFAGPFCNLPDPNQGNQQCGAMCEVYCASLGPDFEVHVSDCEGYCQSGPDEDEACVLHADCTDGGCAGGSLASPHAGVCSCFCLAAGIGSPSRPGGLQCQTGLQTTIELELPCDGTDVDIVLQRACIPVTTETAMATAFNVNAELDPNATFDGITLLGDPGGGCSTLSLSVTSGSKLVGHTTNWDSSIGDVITRTINDNK